MVDINVKRAAVRARLQPEVDLALMSDPDVRVWPPDWADRGEVDYFYKAGSLLTREQDAPRVSARLREIGAAPDATPPGQTMADPAADGLGGGDVVVSAVGIGVSRLRPTMRDSQRTPDLVDDLEKTFGLGVVTHEHVFHVTGGCMCPATEPEAVLAPQKATEAAIAAALWPPRGNGPAGQGVRLSVVDTGLLDGVAGWAPWLTGVTIGDQKDVDIPDQITVDPLGRRRDGFADPYAGHGSFIAGVIRCVAPQSSIVVERAMRVSGFVSEGDMVAQIRQGLARSPGVVSLSAGAYTRHDVPPIGFEQLWTKQMLPQGGVVLVAAAGNDGDTRPFWPAAFDWCVGVGSMDRDGQARSWFSNYGSWVDVYAPGEDLVNAYPKLPYLTFADGEERDTSAGIARWSGTSFSTPVVAALIAARMSSSGQNGRQAAQSLLAIAQQHAKPGVGPRLFP